VNENGRKKRRPVLDGTAVVRTAERLGNAVCVRRDDVGATSREGQQGGKGEAKIAARARKGGKRDVHRSPGTHDEEEGGGEGDDDRYCDASGSASSAVFCRLEELAIIVNVHESLRAQRKVSTDDLRQAKEEHKGNRGVE
jgi:hypothetical protein